MIKILLVAFAACASTNEIVDTIVGKRTRLRPARSSYVSMAYDHTTGVFTSTRDTESIYTEVKINRDGNHYIFSSNGTWLCNEDGELRKCAEPTLFDIEAAVVGFRIRDGNRCLTMDERYRFEMCDRLNRQQEFVLEIDRRLICGDMIIYAPGDERIDLSRKLDVKAVDRAKFKEMVREMKRMSPKTKKAIKKLWTRRKYKWPKWGLC